METLATVDDYSPPGSVEEEWREDLIRDAEDAGIIPRNGYVVYIVNRKQRLAGTGGWTNNNQLQLFYQQPSSSSYAAQDGTDLMKIISLLVNQEDIEALHDLPEGLDPQQSVREQHQSSTSKFSDDVFDVLEYMFKLVSSPRGK
jgi:hypothetical protein